MEKELPDLAALSVEATAFAGGLAPRTDRATLVTLSGELGAGKTAFTQSVAKALGITDAVTSPTFVLEKIYALPAQASFTHLIHIDAYRLTDGAELAALGFDEAMSGAENLIMLEWPERVADMLPDADVRITLRVAGEGRVISYD